MEFSRGVKINWEPSVYHQGACPLCRTEREHKALLKISTGAESMPYDATFLCESCKGVFSYPFAYPDYSEDYSFPDYTRYYCEIGAGVGSMIEAVQNVCRARYINTMIDVGCGTPFTADFARRHLGVDAKGVDPSNYAQQYASLMEVPLSSALLGGGSEFDGQKFDLVFSSEVVEHVEDPIGFVESLADYVTPNGVLVLTTPSAEFVIERPTPLDTMSSIWPEVHHALYSELGFRKLLKKVGFKHVEVIRKRERLFAYASNEPILFEVDDEQNRILVEYYLERTYLRFLSTCPEIARGAAFRLFRDNLNLGNKVKAEKWLASLSEIVQRDFGFSLLEDQELLNNLEAGGELVSSMANRPYFSLVLPYYLGMYALLCDKPESASTYFATQVRIIENIRVSDPLFWKEPFDMYETSVFHEAYALLNAQKRKDAIVGFERIISGHLNQNIGLLADGARNRLFYYRSLIGRGVALLQLGNAGAALSDFEIVIAECRECYANLLDEAEGLLKVAQQQLDSAVAYVE